MKFHGQLTHEKKIIPLHDSDAEVLYKLKANTVYSIEIKQQRNSQFHRKFWALLNTAYKNQEQFKNFEHFRAFCIMKSGFYDFIQTDKGGIYLPKSISFSSMDETEFSQLYEAVFQFVCNFLDVTKDEIIEALKDY